MKYYRPFHPNFNMTKHPQPLFIIRMGRYNLIMLIVYTIGAAACYSAYAIDEGVELLRISLLVLGIVCTV